MTKGKYTIIAGVDRPDTIEVGTLEKGMGQGTITGKTETIVPARGHIAVPNWTEAWGTRVILKDGKVSKSGVDVRDKDYQGQIELMTWGEDGGYMIPCRYLKGYNSIDQQYQDLVLGAKDYLANVQDTEKSAEISYLFMLSGANVYDPEGDKYLIQMYKAHYLNESCKFTSPEQVNHMFREYNVAEEGVKTEKKLDSKREALNIVGDASDDNTLEQLKNLFQVVKAIATETPKDHDLYKYLQGLADTKPDELLAQVAEYKKKISDIVEKAKSFKLIDLKQDGIIAGGDGKKEVLSDNIPGKNDEKIDWVLENYLDPKSWAVVFQLETITSKF